VKILVITPCGREEDVIQGHIDSIMTLKGFDVMFVVDEYTNKETSDILDSNIVNNERIKTLEIENNRGLAGCYIEGYRWFLKSDYDQIIEMDVDSHKVDDLKTFLKKINEGHKIILGSRSLGKNKSSLKRRMISKIGTRLSNYLLGLNLSDCTTGFQSFSKDVVGLIDFENFVSKSFLIQTEIKYNALNIPCDEAIRNCKNLKVMENSCYKFFKFKNGPRFSYIEVPIIYENSKTSLNLKLVFSSFFEFLTIVITDKFQKKSKKT
jgi:dolichol-phosphate mannosyltransferase